VSPATRATADARIAPRNPLLRGATSSRAYLDDRDVFRGQSGFDGPRSDAAGPGNTCRRVSSSRSTRKPAIPRTCWCSTRRRHEGAASTRARCRCVGAPGQARPAAATQFLDTELRIAESSRTVRLCTSALDGALSSG
jgi:hypothetical protein